jgi:hypothetical protein
MSSAAQVSAYSMRLAQGSLRSRLASLKHKGMEIKVRESERM